MDKVIILRYSEIHLKGKNRMFFENILRRNILEKLGKFELKTQFSYGRYVISEYDPEQENRIVSALKTVFGLFSLSIATKTTADPADIAEAAVKLCSETKGTFRVTVNRADKTLPYTSVELAKKNGRSNTERVPRSDGRPSRSRFHRIYRRTRKKHFVCLFSKHTLRGRYAYRKRGQRIDIAFRRDRQSCFHIYDGKARA